MLLIGLALLLPLHCSRVDDTRATSCIIIRMRATTDRYPCTTQPLFGEVQASDADDPLRRWVWADLPDNPVLVLARFRKDDDVEEAHLVSRATVLELQATRSRVLLARVRSSDP
jgi:hypothetical protein